MKKQKTFEFVKTQKEATALVAKLNAQASYYMRKNKPAIFTPWSGQDGKENIFIVWYYI